MKTAYQIFDRKAMKYLETDSFHSYIDAINYVEKWLNEEDWNKLELHCISVYKSDRTFIESFRLQNDRGIPIIVYEIKEDEDELDSYEMTDEELAEYAISGGIE